MEDLVKQIGSDKILVERVTKAFENKRYSIKDISKEDELSILKTRFEINSEKNIHILGFEEIILNLKGFKGEIITRYIIVGKNEAFVFYLDIEKTKLFGYYEYPLTA